MKKLILLATIFMMVIPSNAQVTFDDDEKNQQESPFANGGFTDKRKNVMCPTLLSSLLLSFHGRSS